MELDELTNNSQELENIVKKFKLPAPQTQHRENTSIKKKMTKQGNDIAKELVEKFDESVTP